MMCDMCEMCVCERDVEDVREMCDKDGGGQDSGGRRCV